MHGLNGNCGLQLIIPEVVKFIDFVVYESLAGCGKTQYSVILSEAKNLSWFLFLCLNRREILRFAQNDRTRPFFRSLLENDHDFISTR